MKFPFFATTALLSIVCFVLMLKSFDYGKAWAIALSVVGVLTFGILTIVSLQYQMRKHEEERGSAHH
jgi:hypothetical protein